MAIGLLFVLAAIQPELAGWPFAVGMFIVGAGFGLLASQLGNVNMSAVDKDDTSEVGGLQGTFQNLGSSFGTAIVGSVFILLLSSGFTDRRLAEHVHHARGEPGGRRRRQRGRADHLPG